MTTMALGTATAASATQAAAAKSGAPSKQASFASGNFETFLTMLTTQIKNQDPMNPMENSEFAVQLATFSGVEQQVRTNQLLEGLGGGTGAGGLAQYAGWIGKEARSTAPALFTDQPITLEIAPAGEADKVVLVARDGSGRIASSEEIGTGTGAVDWFGRTAAGAKLPDGSYSFEIESWKDGTKLSTAKVESYSRIVEAESGSGGVKLVTAGGARVPVENVSALREPAEATPPPPATTPGA